MFTVDLYRKVRLACAEGMSQREAARHFGISRDSVQKMLAYSVPPGYRRKAPIKRPKLDGFTEIINAWLEEDRGVPRKQRHTAKRVFERLRDEHGFTGGYTIVKDYIREDDRRGREMFVPLAHAPGHAQADFGEAMVIIDGVEQKAHFFAFDLPHSDACYIRAYPAATSEAWVDGHVHAFGFFGRVPVSVLYDNDRCLVAQILPDGTRKRARLFSGFLSHYLLRDRYGRPGKGNDKGSVEGLVGYARRNFMVPVPRFPSWEAFNAWLEEQCRKRQGDVLRGHTETIGTRLDRDLEVMSALPPAPFDACDQASGRVTSQALVRYKTNDYSVPVAYGHRDVWLRGYVDEVAIGCGGDLIARHPRSYEREDVVFDPLHYLPLIEKKINALDQAAPLTGWELPPEFATLRRLMEARMLKAGRREFVQVLRLLEAFELDDVQAAVKTALRMGAIGFDAVKHLVLCQVEKRPPKLDLDVYPYLPRAEVGKTSAASYMCLISEEAR
ncbi:IS21 family transposase [Thioclava electrotropha]|uniref:IS21 family transposase n=2 Tax=Thioclava electrotropha TaxID=1549850 RepID=A0ABX6Z133_9RHOB|nr:IS21 family transposase [Thioclava electrotropha]